MSKYSIIVISKNNRRMLANCLEKLLAHTPNDVEIVVVEALPVFGETFSSKRIKHIPIPIEKAGFATQRNIGVDESSGDYVIFIDDDVEVEEGWFQKISSAAEQIPSITGCMGAVYTRTSGILSFTAGVMGHPGGGFRLLEFSKGEIIPLSEVATCNTIMRKDDILAVGGFDEKCDKISGEDTDLCARIKEKFGANRFRYLPGARVWHYTTNNAAKMAKWYFRRGKADANLVLFDKSHLSYLIRSSITLKILAVWVAGNFLGTQILLLSALLWYIFQLWKARFMFKYFGFYDFNFLEKIFIYLLFPMNKFLINLIVDLGRINRLVIR